MQNQETIIITRRGAKDVALISAAELASLEETAYLLRSPTNAERLLTALSRSRAGEGNAQTVADLSDSKRRPAVVLAVYPPDLEMLQNQGETAVLSYIRSKQVNRV